jgi:hypothetical protein
VSAQCQPLFLVRCRKNILSNFPVKKHLININKRQILGSSVTVRKHPVSIALSNRVLEKIDKEASKQKRSRSEFVELHFENVFFEQKSWES